MNGSMSFGSPGGLNQGGGGYGSSNGLHTNSAASNALLATRMSSAQRNALVAARGGGASRPLSQNMFANILASKNPVPASMGNAGMGASTASRMNAMSSSTSTRTTNPAMSNARMMMNASMTYGMTRNGGMPRRSSRSNVMPSMPQSSSSSSSHGMPSMPRSSSMVNRNNANATTMPSLTRTNLPPTNSMPSNDNNNNMPPLTRPQSLSMMMQRSSSNSRLPRRSKSPLRRQSSPTHVLQALNESIWRDYQKLCVLERSK